jgi:BCD family chlorophyll transporter-like MFS transporter
LLFGWLLADFNAISLIRVVQSAALLTLVLNVIALWKQEARDPLRASEIDSEAPSPSFRAAWSEISGDSRATRLLVAVALGTAGFTMQDILLEPFGGEILNMSVGATTGLTALLAGGMLIAFAYSAKRLGRGTDPHRLAAYGALIGIAAFAMVTMVTALKVMLLFALGVLLIGVGGGLFAVGTLTAAMALTHKGNSGLALGAWGAVQATASGVAIATGGALRDVVSELATRGSLGLALVGPETGYLFVYHLEVLLLFATLVAIGPLAAFSGRHDAKGSNRFGLAEFPN